MFRNIARQTLRRGLHTAAPRTAASGGQHLAMAAARCDAPSSKATKTPSSKPSEPPSAPAPPPTDSTAPPPPEGSEPAPPEAEGDEPAAEGAFNPDTGEINWDCPCLGGMAHGPCGEQFRAAFSCFVFSEAEPKGIDCVELFKAMQDCFREHPEVYGEEIMRDEEEEGAPVGEGASVLPPADPAIVEGVALEASTGFRRPSHNHGHVDTAHRPFTHY
ncbi:hypothetical protein EWM64_g9223 [Hericium alpestre]|uniref:Mitochondrial intermembrane space import and assembly protein 40 n=1 Tax=Hericium alpestre TaxID=135208 RepID=A0A4Y9ZKQ7_9AGAM|nr:hypothetical protein EWM64_g9223 [Hericium alpestre]